VNKIEVNLWESIVLASIVIAILLLASFPGSKSNPQENSTTLIKENYTISALEHAVYMQKSANEVIDCYKRLHNSLVFGATQSQIEELESELAGLMRRHNSNSYNFTKRLKKVSSQLKLRVKA